MVVDLPLHAELVANTGVAVLDTLVVRSSQPSGGLSPQVGAVVSKVTLETGTGSRDLADLLSRAAGLQMRRYGGLGASAVPSLRGSAGAQVKLLIDGLPLDDAQSGLVGLNNLPLERFASAEIHRGQVPIGLGGNSGVGAINLLTRAHDPGLDLSLLTGSFGDVGGRLSWGDESLDGRISGLLLVHGRQTDNDFEFKDHKYTFHTTDDDTVRVRENAWQKQWGAWGVGNLEGDHLEASISAGFYRRDGGRPGPMGMESPNAGVRYDRTDARLGFSIPEAGVRLDFAGGQTQEFLYDPQGEVGFLPRGVTRSQSPDVSGRLLWSFSPVHWLDVDLGVEARRQWYRQWFNDDQDPLRRRTTTATFAGLNVPLAEGRLLVSPSWRWQRSEDNFPPVPPLPWLPELEAVTHIGDHVSPACGVIWEVTSGKGFLELHAGQSVRVPTWVELFGHRGGIVGNRDLLPEDILSLDLAFTRQLANGGASIRLAAFQVDTDQAIVFEQNSQRTSTASNVGQTRTRGLELEASVQIPQDLVLDFNLTQQSAKDRSSDNPVYQGNRLPYLPSTEVWISLAKRAGLWRPHLTLNLQSDSYRDRANSELNKSPGRELVGVGVTWVWQPSWLPASGLVSVAAEVSNLTDNQVYDIEGYPLPGRTWHVSVRLQN